VVSFNFSGAGSKPIPAININGSGVGGANWVSSDVPSTSSSIQAPATVSVDEGVSLPPASSETAAENNASSVVSKAQSKGKHVKEESVWCYCLVDPVSNSVCKVERGWLVLLAI